MRFIALVSRLVSTHAVRVGVLLATCSVSFPTPQACAQDPPPAPASEPQAIPIVPVLRGEEVEPRIIGVRGTLSLGIAGHAERAFSTESFFSTNYTAQSDASYFLTGKIVLRGGLAGSGSIGGDEDTTWPTGTGAPALHAFGGAHYYFTPRSIWSLYGGLDYWAQLTQRPANDRGMLVPTAGLQAAVSSRVSLFGEFGYGFGLARGSEGELVTRMSGRIGFRLRLKE